MSNRNLQQLNSQDRTVTRTVLGFLSTPLLLLLSAATAIAW